MSENWNAVPRVTQFDEADITELMAQIKILKRLIHQIAKRRLREQQSNACALALAAG